MNDMELLNWMIAKYGDQKKMAAALKLNAGKFSEGTISNWKKAGKVPRGWLMYFQAQFDKE